MNAGIADADEPGWMLAARAAGLGASPRMLDAYQAERQPITEQVSHFACNMSQEDLAAAPRDSAEIERDDAGGEATRAQHRQGGLRSLHAAVMLRRPELRLLLRRLADHRLRRRGAAGLFDGHSSHRRRCRAAARRISGCATAARSTTRWAPDYTLLRFDPRGRRRRAGRGGEQARRAARRARHRRREAADALRRKLVLVRPDQHVAWRGDAEPADALELIDHLRGAVAARPRSPRSRALRRAAFRLD